MHAFDLILFLCELVPALGDWSSCRDTQLPGLGPCSHLGSGLCSPVVKLQLEAGKYLPSPGCLATSEPSPLHQSSDSVPSAALRMLKTKPLGTPTHKPSLLCLGVTGS